MRVAHIIARLETGGAEHALLRLAGGVAERGIEQRVFALLPGGALLPRFEAAGLRPLTLDLRRRPVLGLWTLGRALHDWQPHVVQTWMYHADVIGGLVARAVGLPVVWAVRQTAVGEVATSTSVALMYRAARILSSRVPAAVVFNAQAAERSHRAWGYRHTQSRLVYNGMDAITPAPEVSARAALRHELGLAPNTPLVGHLGRYTPEKDHAALLQAFAFVATARPTLQLVAAGRGVDTNNGALVAAIDRLALHGRIHLLGDRRDAQQVLSALDVFVLSSRHEGFPNALLEAMALGLPCVTTDCGDAAHLAGDAAFVVPAGDAAALGRALMSLCDADATLRHRLSIAAAERVARHFTLDAMCDGFEAIWREFARRPDDNQEGANHVRHRRTTTR